MFNYKLGSCGVTNSIYTLFASRKGNVRLCIGDATVDLNYKDAFDFIRNGGGYICKSIYSLKISRIKYDGDYEQLHGEKISFACPIVGAVVGSFIDFVAEPSTLALNRHLSAFWYERLPVEQRHIRVVAEALNVGTCTVHTYCKYHGHEIENHHIGYGYPKISCKGCDNVKKAEIIEQRVNETNVEFMGVAKHESHGSDGLVLLNCENHGLIYNSAKRCIQKKAACHLCDTSPRAIDSVYVWRAIGLNPDGTDVFKIGVTNSESGNRRIESVAKSQGLEYEVIHNCRVKITPHLLERLLLDLGTPYHIEGDGGTEYRELTAKQLGGVQDYIDYFGC